MVRLAHAGPREAVIQLPETVSIVAPMSDAIAISAIAKARPPEEQS